MDRLISAVRNSIKHVTIDTLVGFFCVTGGVCFATALFWSAGRRVDPWQISLLYLPVVIACAVRFGFATSVWGAILSFICWDYFLLNPVYAWRIANFRDLIALIVFVTAAITTSRLASGARQQAREADARASEARTLYMVSQVVGREIDASQLLETLAGEVVRLCDASACAVIRCSPTLDNVAVVSLSAGISPDQISESGIVQNAQKVLYDHADILLRHNVPMSDSITRSLVAPVRLDGESGGLYLPLHVDGIALGLMFVGYKEEESSFSFQNERLILTLASQAAVVMARDRLTEEATKQAQKVAILGERNRLAKEVHDTLSHAFTGIRFLMEAAAVSGPDEVSGLVAQARQLAIDGAQEARRSVWALRPVALEDGRGIVQAVRSLMQQQTYLTSIEGTLDVSGDERLLTGPEEDNLLRICQEALTNVIRHAGATKVSIAIKFSPHELMLTITDNGSGFDRSEMSDGFGLVNMEERASLIGGAFGVTTKPGAGTEIQVTVPFK